MNTVTTAAWSMANGSVVNGSNTSAFMAGFGMCEFAAAVVFGVAMSFWMFKKLVRAAVSGPPEA